jgi:hypothetical protein
MALRFVRLNGSIVAAPLILAFCLLGVLPHGHAPRVSDTAPVFSGDSGHAPHADPCLEPGAVPHSHAACAICCFQRLLSGSQIVTYSCGAPLFISARIPAPPRAAARSTRAGSAAPRGPPAA